MPAPLSSESPLALCRDCRGEVSTSAVTCPHCGAPRPSRAEWNGEGYDYRSTATFHGWPLVHIAFGIDREGKVRTARGVFAIGQRAVGGVAVGILSLGVISLGVVCGGVLSFGVVAAGLAVACGVNAIAPVAIGVVAIGGLVGGVQAVGWKTLFSLPPALR